MSAARSYKRLILSRPCLLVKQVFSFLWQKPFTSLFSEPSGKKAMCKAVHCFFDIPLPVHSIGITQLTHRALRGMTSTMAGIMSATGKS